jgi:hypothetical protein
MDETFSYKLGVLKKTQKDDGIYYGIEDSETGILIHESQDLAFTEASTNLNQVELYADLHEYRSVGNDELDKLIDDNCQVAVRGSIKDELWKPDFLANRIIIIWSRL